MIKILKVGSFSFEYILILLIYFRNCQKQFLQGNENVIANNTELKV